MQNYKILLPDAEIAAKVQEKLFRLGYTWLSGASIVSYLDRIHSIELLNNTLFYFNESNSRFVNSTREEISYQDFLALPEPNQENAKSLPERWYIKPTREQFRIVADWASIENHKNLGIYNQYINYVYHDSVNFNFLGRYREESGCAEISFEDFERFILNKTITMSELKLKCVKEPQKTKNITIGREYTGILINDDDTQVDSFDEATGFLCTNNNGVEAKYRISLFEKPTPPPPPQISMEEYVNTIVVNEENVVIGNEITGIQNINGCGRRSLALNGSGCSCGINSIDGLATLRELIFERIRTPRNVIDFGIEEATNAIFTRVVKAKINNASLAFVLMSVTSDEDQVEGCIDTILSEFGGIKTETRRNPNSGNDILAWIINKPV